MFRTVFMLLLAISLAPPAFAQAGDAPPLPLDRLQAELVAGKQSLVARTLSLTSAEEADFWPVYDELQRGLADVTARRREARTAIAEGGDDAADGIEELVEADVEHAELLERAWNRLRGALPPAKLARYLDLERRIAAAELF